MKYHINKNGVKAVCTATKRACRYTQHFTVTPEQEFLQKTEQINETQRLANLEPSPLKYPRTKYYAPSSYSPLFFYSDPYYGDENAPLSTEVEDVDLKELLAMVHDTTPGHITAEYVQYAKTQGWDNPAHFYGSTQTGTYYNEVEIEVELSDNLLNQIREHYIQKPNAVDTEGIYDYCRNKGYDTTGKTPVEAIKAQLKKENGNKPHPKVDAATTVRTEQFSVNKLRIPATNHYEQVEARPLTPTRPGADIIAGVVTEDAHGNYTLVDGYHRVKGIVAGRRKYYKFIVLSGK